MHAKDLIYFRACQKIFVIAIRAETLSNVKTYVIENAQSFTLFYCDDVFFGAGHYGDIFNNQRQMENVKKENWNKLKWSTM